ncbi:MAG: hypothetical protein Q9181_007793, partial [Wetmoreana brouardii]
SAATKTTNTGLPSLMARLTLDPQYRDSYSEYSSSNSSFSCGLLTPNSTADFSAATSRRQSIASEVQACNDGAFDKLPIFSRTEGATTPFKTSPYRSASRSDNFSPGVQGYETTLSPLEIHRQRRVGIPAPFEQPQFLDPFASQAPYFPSIAGSGLEVASQEHDHQDEADAISPMTVDGPPMDWSSSFGGAFDQGYGQADWAGLAEALDPGPSSRLGLSYVHPSLLAAPTLVDFGTTSGTAAETDLPQTVAPQETFVWPGASFSTPLSPPTQPACQLPIVKSQDKTCSPASPCSSLPAEESPTRRSSSAIKRRGLLDASKHSPPGTLNRSSKGRQERRSMRRVHIDGRPFDVPTASSSNKTHRCEICMIPFGRPEHYKRHIKSEAHIKKERGDDNINAKQWACRVKSCQSILTRKDNLKPHYQNCHFYDKEKNGKRQEAKKRRAWVSPEEAMKLGKGHWDLRTEFGRTQANDPKARTRKVSDEPEECDVYCKIEE